MALIPLKQERSVPTGSRSIAAADRREALIVLPNGQPWMGPGQPQQSSMPAGTEPRTYAYPIFFNANGDVRSAKSYEADGISFADMRALAKQPHVRAAIETVKNKQTKVRWVYTLKPKPGERVTELRERERNDRRVAEVTDFFESPDGEHDLADWLRMYLEDTLVLDAPAVYNVRRKSGQPFELEIFDGATIKPLIDETGRTPRGDQPAYQQWLYGQPGDKFTRAEMMYAPRNPMPGRVFGCSPVEQLCLYINIAMRKDLQRLNTYTDGNIPAGLLPMPQDWDTNKIAAWYFSFNTFVKGIAQNQVKLVPVPGGIGTPVFPSLEANKDQWEESWIRLVCFQFDVPVSALVREMTRANAEANRDATEQDGAAAMTDYIGRRLNWIIRNWFGYRDIIAKPETERDVEAGKQAEIDERRVRMGLDQINELRERDGKPPIPELEGVYGYFGPKGFATFSAALAPPPAPVVPGGDGPKRIEAGTPPATEDEESDDGETEDVDEETIDEADDTEEGDVEKAAPPFDYASTQVNLDARTAKRVRKLAATIPDDALAEKGREDQPHITVRFGLDPETTPAMVAEALSNSDTVREMGSRGGAHVVLGKTAHFETDEYDVVYVEVASQDLQRLHKTIKRAIGGTDTHEYVPHVTLAYVKKGRGSEFDGMDAMDGAAMHFRALHHSDTDGKLTRIALPKIEAEKAASKKKRLTLNRPDLVEKHATAFTEKIETFLGKQATLLAETISAQYAESIKADKLEITIDWSDLVAALTPALEDLFIEGAEAAAEDLGTGPFRRLNSVARDWARERAAEMVGKRWENGQLVDNPNAELVISETTRENLRALVARAFDEGMTPRDLKAAILESTDFSAVRAKRIADYELAAAQSAGSWKSWEESGVVEKKGWVLSIDHPEYDGCNINAEAGEIPMDQPFPSGHMTAPLHAGCKCDVYAVVATE